MIPIPLPGEKAKSTTDECAGGWGGKNYTPNLWIKYKLTREAFNKLFWNQDGKCAGCLKVFAHPINKDSIGAPMAARCEVDHDHKTGKVRGLLCRRCNDFLGKIKDNRETLARLVEYLKRNGDW